MRYLLVSLILSTLFVSLQAQETLKYSRAKIHLDHFRPFQLGSLGVDMTHGHWHEGSLESDFSHIELARFKAAGFRVEILIEDVQTFYVQQNEGLSYEIDRSQAYTRSTDCFDDEETVSIPTHFRLGTMGGFFTYEEMLEHLDSMKILFPDLITARQVAGNNKTIEGRDVYWLRISNNPDVEEDEPEVFYSSITHAREPGGLSQMIFYMWYLLENYDRDPEIRRVVDNTQLYFMPCVNPDGYIYNQTTNPLGGGLWRKNKRDNNNDGIFDELIDGVDLNRNYGYEWGDQHNGSSGDPSSAVYRGTEAFSEPETQIFRDFCESRKFRVALNYHTHGDLLIYPFSYADSLPDPRFVVAGELLTRENNYRYGTPTQTVGYQVNGDVNDWMYGENTTKPSTYSFVPEVGDGGFWPRLDRILPHCLDNIWQNLSAARLAMSLTDWEPTAFEWEENGALPYRLEYYGFDDTTVTIEAFPLTNNIDFVPTRQFVPMSMGEIKLAELDYTLDPSIKHGDTIAVRITWTAGGTIWEDTVQQVYFNQAPVWADSGEDLMNWNLISIGSNFQRWSTTNLEFYSAPTSITDSPNGPYPSNVRSVMTNIDAIQIPADADQAELIFYAKWELEEDRDYVQVLIAPDGTTAYEPLCGLYTNEGVIGQNRAEGEPVYDGVKDYWVREQIDLSEYVGEWVRFRFVFQSDVNNDGSEGFFLDDLALHVYNTSGTTSITPLEANRQGLLAAQPNPSKYQVSIQLEINGQSGELVIYDLLGREVERRTVASGQKNLNLDVKEWPAGVYWAQLDAEDGSRSSLKLVKK